MTLDSTWEQKILDFETAYRSLNISITPKVHSVFYEIPIFILRHNKPLGFFTEQKFETVHTDFLPTWNRFKCNENNPNFPSRLTDATVHYNGAHI